jgi:hypothetical protein
VGAALDDAAGVHDQDLVGIHDRRQTVRDDQRRAAARRAVEAGLDGLFGLRVERRGRFVKDQEWRVLQQGAGDGDALFLAARELEAAFADAGS